MRFLALLWSMFWASALWATPPKQVVFSELMWMGSPVSSADEWIELYNRSSAAIELAGWTITRQLDESESIMLRIEEGTIAPGATFLIANFPPDDPRSALAVQAQLATAAVSLPNTKLQLRLYDGNPKAGAHLVDIADDGGGAPLAGDPQLKKAMVRVLLDTDGSLPISWATAEDASGWDEGVAAYGSPGSVTVPAAAPDSSLSTDFRPSTWASFKMPQ